MGLITNLLKQKHDEEWRDKEMKLSGLSQIIGSQDPMMKPETKSAALSDLVEIIEGGQGKKSKKKDYGPETGGHHPIKSILGAMAGLGGHLGLPGMGEQGQGQQAEQQGQQGPVPAQPGPQQMAPSSLKTQEDYNIKHDAIPVGELPLPPKPMQQGPGQQQAPQQPQAPPTPEQVARVQQIAQQRRVMQAQQNPATQGAMGGADPSQPNQPWWKKPLMYTPEEMEAQQAKAEATKERIHKQQIQGRRSDAESLGVKGEALQDYALTDKLPTRFGDAPAKAASREQVIKGVMSPDGKPSILRVKADGTEQYLPEEPKPEKPVNRAASPEDKLAQAYQDANPGMTPQQARQRAGETITKVEEKKLAQKATATRGTGSRSRKAVGGHSSVASANRAIKADSGMHLAAWDYLTTGKLPALGIGKEAAAYKKEVIDMAGEVTDILGVDPSEVMAFRAGFVANKSSLSKLTWQQTSMNQFEGTLEKNMKLAERMNDQFSRTSSPMANRIVNYVRTGAGDATTNNFMAQMGTIATEYAKVMQGSVSSTGATVNSDKEAREIINGYLGKGQVKELFALLNKDMANRKQSIFEEKQRLITQIKSSPGTTEAAPVAANPEANSGGTVVQKNKKTGAFRYSTDGGKTWQAGKPQ